MRNHACSKTLRDKFQKTINEKKSSSTLSSNFNELSVQLRRVTPTPRLLTNWTRDMDENEAKVAALHYTFQAYKLVANCDVSAMFCVPHNATA